MPTIAQVMDRISYLRSKLAIDEAMLMHLQSNYTADDKGFAEMYMDREDHARVPEKHIEEYINEIVERSDQVRAELDEWESLDVVQPQLESPEEEGEEGEGEAEEEAEEEEEAAPVAPEPKKGTA